MRNMMPIMGKRKVRLTRIKREKCAKSARGTPLRKEISMACELSGQQRRCQMLIVFMLRVIIDEVLVRWRRMILHRTVGGWSSLHCNDQAWHLRVFAFDASVCSMCKVHSLPAIADCPDVCKVACHWIAGFDTHVEFMAPASVECCGSCCDMTYRDGGLWALILKIAKLNETRLHF
jgi:hypothetical protein